MNIAYQNRFINAYKIEYYSFIATSLEPLVVIMSILDRRSKALLHFRSSTNHSLI